MEVIMLVNNVAKVTGEKKKILLLVTNVNELLKVDPFLSESKGDIPLIDLKKNIELKSIALDTIEAARSSIIEFNADETVLFGTSGNEVPIPHAGKVIHFSDKKEFDSFLNSHIPL